ncbi:MAG: class I SAM-dependent methyltransferase [Actinomycetes bacterium]
MPEPLAEALDVVRALLLDPDALVRAVAAGRRRGRRPVPARVELRPVDLKTGRHLQVVAEEDSGPRTSNFSYDGEAAGIVERLLGEPFGNWHVETTVETLQLRVTKKGLAQLHRRATTADQQTSHDQPPAHLVDPGDPMFAALGAGADKRRQVDAFVRVLAGAVEEAELPDDRPLRVADLGCGNAYLTFAAYRHLTAPRVLSDSRAGPTAAESDNSRGWDVELVGVDLRPQARERNTRLAAELGWADRMRFVEGAILGAPVDGADIVLALHACDTATDDALAQAVRWRAPLVLAAPCCHHDLQRQLKAGMAPPPYGALTRHPILREHLGDVLTDGLRASLMRQAGYRVEVSQFVASRHTPRNTMLKAVRAASTGAGTPSTEEARAEYDDLVAQWRVRPYLRTLLDDAG